MIRALGLSRRGGQTSEIFRQIGANSVDNWGFGRRQLKRLASDGLVGADIEAGGLEDDFARYWRNRIAVGIAARGDPAAQKILVERFGRLPGREAAVVGIVHPISAAVRRMDLVGEDDLPVSVEAKCVFRDDEDKTPLGGNSAAARE